MAMNNGVDIGSHLVDFAMDEPFGMERATLQIDCVAVEIELHNVTGGHISRSYLARPCHEKSVRVFRMTEADMTVGVEHALIDKNPVGQGKLGKPRLINVGEQKSGWLRSRSAYGKGGQCTNHADGNGLDNKCLFTMHPPGSVHSAWGRMEAISPRRSRSRRRKGLAAVKFGHQATRRSI